MKKTCFLIILLLCSLSPSSDAKVFKDSLDHIYLLKDGAFSVSFDNGRIWQQQKSPSGESTILENSAGVLHMISKDDRQVYLSLSKDHGISFDRPKAVFSFDGSIESFSPRIMMDSIFFFYLRGAALNLVYSSDIGSTFSTPQMLNNNLPASSYSISPDGKNIYFRSGDKVYRVIFDNGWRAPEPFYTINNDINDLVALNDCLLLVKKAQNGKHQLILSRIGDSELLIEDDFPLRNLTADTSEVFSFSLLKGSDYLPFYIMNNGRFSRAKPVRNDILPGEAFEQLAVLKDAPAAIFISGKQINLFKLENNAPSRPSLTVKRPSTNGKLSITVTADDPDNDPLIFETTISLDRNFKSDNSWIYRIGSIESDIPLPLPDGKYFIKATAKDKLSDSPASDIIEFTVDRTPPKITVSRPEKGSVVNERYVLVQGSISEEAKMLINSQPTGLTGYSFSKSIELKPGENRISITATDESGNSSFESFTLIFNEKAPIIKILKPLPSACFKGGSTIMIEAEVNDKQMDVEDESEAEVIIDGQKLEDKLIFDRTEGKLGGFVRIPNDLSSGIHNFKLTLTDLGGNLGIAFGKLIIDSTPPETIRKSVSVTNDRINVPFKEEESGIDCAASIIKVSLGSREVAGKIRAETGQLVFVPVRPFDLDSALEVKITLRDLVGNVGKEETFTLHYDKVSALSIAKDDGNSIKFLDLAFGPNPFSPSAGQSSIIKYELSRPAEIRFYIFTIDGSLISSRSISSGASGSISWGGSDLSGQTLSPGVYLFALTAQNSSGRSDIKRGQIILQ